MEGHAYSARGPARARRRGAAAASPRAGAIRALALAGVLLAALALLYLLASRVEAVRLRDASLLYHLTLVSTPGLESAGTFLLNLLDPAVYVCWTAAIVAVALARGLPRLALAAAATALLAPLSSEALKPVLAVSHDTVGDAHIGAASFPSGHSTAVLALVLAAALVSPPRLRPLVAAAGAGVAAVVGALLLILAWHMPSDVLGGYLMAGFWCALAVAALRARERPRAGA